MDITPYRFDKEIVRATAERLIRDFEHYDIVIRFSGNEDQAYDELCSQLVPVIDHLASANSSLLMQLLYRIDISEQQLKKGLETHTDKSFSEVVAHLLLEREMQKVLTRKLFKDRNGV